MATGAAKAAALSAAADEISKLEGITLASAKRSATVAETRFEREVKGLKSAIADLKTDLRSAIASDLVAQKLDKMNDAKERALSMFDIAVQKDETGCDLEEFDAKQELICSTASTMTSEVLKALKSAKDATASAGAAPRPRGDAQGGPGGVGGVAMVNDVVKPDNLLVSSTPAEMELWKDSLRSWFVTAGIDDLELTTQQVFAKATIDKKLLLKIDWQFNSTTAVFGDENSIVSAVEAEFDVKYPLFMRRLEFFNFQRSPNTEPGIYVAQIAKLAKEAKINDMSYDDHLVMRAMTGMNDNKILNKLLEMKEPKWPDVRKKITDYEVVTASSKSANAEKESAAAAANRISSAPGRFDKPRGQSNSVNTPEDLKGRCNVCGSHKHRRNECPHKDTAECRGCKKKGHMSNVCLDKYYQELNRQKQQGQETKTKVSSVEEAPRPATDASGSARLAQGQWGTSPDYMRWADEVEEAEAKNLVKNIVAEDDESEDEYFSAEEDDGEPFADLVELAKLAGRQRLAKAELHEYKERVNALYSERPSIPTPKCEIEYEDSAGNKFKFATTPDTGAWRTFVAQDVLERFGIQFDQYRQPNAWAANGGRMECSGTAYLVARRRGREVWLKAAVSPGMKNEILLSWHEMVLLGLLPEGWPNCQVMGASSTECMAVRTEPEAKLADIVEEYSDVLADELPDKPMKCEPMSIHLKPDATPVKIMRARNIPLHWQAEAEKVINDLLERGIIRSVDGVTKWISPAQFVPKDSGEGLRFVTDFSGLNKFVERPVHPFPSVQDILQQIPASAEFFLVMDAKQGYYQLALDEASQELTTFLLPWGKFCYTRGPMGLNATNDVWCKESDEIVANRPWAEKIVDDVLAWASSEAELLARFRDLLESCRKVGITISKKKLQFGKRVKFAGHIVQAGAIHPDPERVKAISDFPRPADATQLRSFLGLVNQLSNFVPDLSQMTARMRELLKKDAAFVWVAELEEDFERVKSALTDALTINPFDPQLPLELLTDASKLNGLGFMLLQREPSGKPRVIQCGSFALTAAQKNYAVIELEMLAIVEAVKKCDFYLRGCPSFSVVTDHKPLEGIFRKPLTDISNDRLLRFREALMSYSFTVTWRAGKTHEIADALSRAPVFGPPDFDVSCNGGLCQRIVCIDLFDFRGDTYLAAVDAFSGFPFCHKLTKTATENVCSALNNWFSQFGFPAKIKSDNGPQFRGPFTEWCSAKGVKHVTSSPFNPQSNGRAEAAVKNLKRLLQKCYEAKESFVTALTEFRGMPREDGPSPNFLMFGRELRGALPRLEPSALSPAQAEGAKARAEAADRQARQHDRRAHELTQLEAGQMVWVQNATTKLWDTKGEIRKVCEHGRSYIISDGEKEFRRNRKFLRPAKCPTFAEVAAANVSPPPAPTESTPRRSARLLAKQKTE